MPPKAAGQIATVLVAFAATGDNLSHISVGNDTSVPPPATALIIPAAKPAQNARAECIGVKYQETGNCSHAASQAWRARHALIGKRRK
jgi:hypothetical protein